MGRGEQEDRDGKDVRARLNDRFPGREVQVDALMDMLHEVSLAAKARLDTCIPTDGLLFCSLSSPRLR